jgi:DNA-binding protein Fis
LRAGEFNPRDHMPEVAALHQALFLEAADASAETALLAALRRIGHDKAQVITRRNIEAVTSAVERCVETYECFGGNLYEQLNRQLQKTLIRRVMLQCNGAPAVAAAILGISQVLLESKLLEFGLGWAAARAPAHHFA